MLHAVCLPAGGVKKAGDPDHPKKLQFLSFLVMEHLGHSIGCLSLEMQTYTNNRKLLVNHGLGMLKVSTHTISCTASYLHPRHEVQGMGSGSLYSS